MAGRNDFCIEREGETRFTHLQHAMHVSTSHLWQLAEVKKEPIFTIRAYHITGFLPESFS